MTCKPRKIIGNDPYSAIPKDYNRYCGRIIGDASAILETLGPELLTAVAPVIGLTDNGDGTYTADGSIVNWFASLTNIITPGKSYKVVTVITGGGVVNITPNVPDGQPDILADGPYVMEGVYTGSSMVNLLFLRSGFTGTFSYSIKERL